jgi:hypothetical protein
MSGTAEILRRGEGVCVGTRDTADSDGFRR